jgi:hypothetical protein
MQLAAEYRPHQTTLAPTSVNWDRYAPNRNPSLFSESVIGTNRMVTPAKTGIQGKRSSGCPWTSVFAGVTGKWFD